jgi:hypothetical protein
MYLFGRVVRSDALWTLRDPEYRDDDARANLAYVYDHVSAEPDLPDKAVLSRDSLLVPPFFVDRLWWSRGYFQTITNLPLTDDDVLPQYCFQRPSNKRYYDEYNNELPGPVEPVGSFALPTIGWIDSKISAALGLHRSLGDPAYGGVDWYGIDRIREVDHVAGAEMRSEQVPRFHGRPP